MYKFIMLSSLEKVFTDYTEPEKEYTSASSFLNEIFSYQIAYKATDEVGWMFRTDFDVSVESELKDCITLCEVVNVPSEYPVRDIDGDEDILRSSPGLYPDLLSQLEDGRISATKNTFHSLWVKINPDGKYAAGKYTVKLRFSSGFGEYEKTFTLELIDKLLPEQETIFTNWFHSDCIGSVYGVRVFSEKYWSLVEKFMKAASESGVNMILTPLFTPPLDTEIGGERPTVQLVGVTKKAAGYEFDFSLLDKWIDLSEKCGIRYFEMSHLFTQWGAKAAPKIIATVNGRKKRIFGWDTPADSREYICFLDEFLPALKKHLTEKGIAERCVFHISDEPSGEEQHAAYIRAKNIISRHLEGFKIVDALSDIGFYKSGAVTNPIPATDAIEPFLEEDIGERWTYYCCGQIKGCSNQFFGMPSARNRIIGAQMYKYNIKGFLQWGFNFYYTGLSRGVIDPFRTTDAKCCFPSGDAFRVYPGKDGPMESVRLCVFRDALTDIRALKLLETYIGHEAVVGLIEEKLGHIAFTMEPVSAEQILTMREAVNEEIKKYC